MGMGKFNTGIKFRRNSRRVEWNIRAMWVGCNMGIRANQSSREYHTSCREGKRMQLLGGWPTSANVHDSRHGRATTVRIRGANQSSPAAAICVHFTHRTDECRPMMGDADKLHIDNGLA